MRRCNKTQRGFASIRDGTSQRERGFILTECNVNVSVMLTLHDMEEFVA